MDDPSPVREGAAVVYCRSVELASTTPTLSGSAGTNFTPIFASIATAA